MRKMGRVSKEQQDVVHAEESYQQLNRQREQLENELLEEINKIESGIDPSTIQIEKVIVKPKKADIRIEEVAILWRPSL